MGYHDLGVLYLEDQGHALQKEGGAEQAFNKAIAIRKKLYEADEESCAIVLAQSYERLAVLLFGKRRLEESAATYEKAIAIWEDVLPRQVDAHSSRDIEICYRNAHMAYQERLAELDSESVLFGQVALKTKELLRSRVRLYSMLAEAYPEEYESRLREAYGDLAAECMRIFYRETKEAAFQAVVMYAKQYNDRPDQVKGDLLQKQYEMLKNVYAFAPIQKERKELEHRLESFNIKFAPTNEAID